MSPSHVTSAAGPPRRQACCSISSSGSSTTAATLGDPVVEAQLGLVVAGSAGMTVVLGSRARMPCPPATVAPGELPAHLSVLVLLLCRRPLNHHGVRRPAGHHLPAGEHRQVTGSPRSSAPPRSLPGLPGSGQQRSIAEEAAPIASARSSEEVLGGGRPHAMCPLQLEAEVLVVLFSSLGKKFITQIPLGCSPDTEQPL